MSNNMCEFIRRKYNRKILYNRVLVLALILLCAVLLLWGINAGVMPVLLAMAIMPCFMFLGYVVCSIYSQDKMAEMKSRMKPYMYI